jgi:hypothetical protein
MDLMIDIETWGTLPGSAIRSIGAVVFDVPRRHIVSRFYEAIVDDPHNGLTIDEQTVQWWSEQSLEAKAAFINPRPLLFVVQAFEAFRKSFQIERCWAKPPQFDYVLWEAAARAVGVHSTIPHRDIRDVRTMMDVLRYEPPEELKGSMITHHALDDVTYQARIVMDALGKTRVIMGR